MRLFLFETALTPSVIFSVSVSTFSGAAGNHIFIGPLVFKEEALNLCTGATYGGLVETILMPKSCLNTFIRYRLKSYKVFDGE